MRPTFVGAERELLVAAVREEPELVAQAERDADRVEPPAGLGERGRALAQAIRDREKRQHAERVVDDDASQETALRAGKAVHVLVDRGAEIIRALHHRNQLAFA
jgi:hypothetical protein